MTRRTPTVLFLAAILAIMLVWLSVYVAVGI
jgi:uncharacterized membrane-anchored protein